MKMEWNERNELIVGGVFLYVVYEQTDEEEEPGYQACSPTLPYLGPFDTIEAAKAAAEKAVKEWFRECLGEPVLWRYEPSKGRYFYSEQAPTDEDTARHGDDVVTPLYALEADDNE